MSKMTDVMAAWGPTVLRLGVGVVFFAHGAQHMWGWYGGPGLSNWMNFLAATGTPKWLAFLAAFSEFFGGVGLLLGLFTRLSAFGIFCVMLVAVFQVHLKSGFFMNWAVEAGIGHGIEFSLTLLSAAFSLILTGCGKLGLDNLIWKKKQMGV